MTKCSEISEADPTLPLDRPSVIARVRFGLGNTTNALVTDELIGQLIDIEVAKYGDFQIYWCDITYEVLLGLIDFLILNELASKGSSTGAEIRRKESRGDREIEIQYSDGTTSDSGWEQLKDYWFTHPHEICDCLSPDVSNSPYGLIKIGGTSQTDYVANNTNPNLKTMWDGVNQSDQFTIRRDINAKRTRNRGKFYYRTGR